MRCCLFGAGAGMGAFGVQKLREEAAEVLLGGRHGKFDAFLLHFLVELLQVFYGEVDALDCICS